MATSEKPPPGGFLGYARMDPRVALTSPFISVGALAGLRTLLACYSLAVGITSFYIDAQENIAGYWFFYYTNLTYVCLIAYFINAAVHTVAYARLCAKAVTYPKPSTLQQGSVLTQMHFALYAAVVSVHIVVPVVYFALLFDPKKPEVALNEWTNFSQHGGDLACVLVEVVLGGMVYRWKDAVPGFVGSIIYLFWMWIVYAIWGIWAYGFLAFSRGPKVTVWYFAIVAIYIAAVCVQYALHWVKWRIAQRVSKKPRFYQPYTSEDGARV